MNRKYTIPLLALGVGLIAAVAAWLAPGLRPMPIGLLLVGTPPESYSGLIAVAQAKGYFEDNGLKIALRPYAIGHTALAALSNKELDVALASDFTLATAAVNGKPYRIVASTALADVSKLVARGDRGIDEPSDLRGKRIAYERDTVLEQHLATFLQLNGIELHEVEEVDLDSGYLAEALAEGSVDAAVLRGVVRQDALDRLGANAREWPAQGGVEFYWVLAARPETLQEKPAEVRSFLRALLRAEQFLVDNEAEARRIIADWTLGSKSPLPAVDEVWFEIALEQALVLSLEQGAAWRLRGHGGSDRAPNFLEYIDPAPLLDVAPPTVTLLR
ncbi:ABC transporter substrate-binding protein [Desulfocurvibacter africanus]|uniref:ABC-type transporter, periplasmic subunit family 3 n=1 Tax=Desulfocurvibacter africanus subsp. africanus str. Walvis Bay TaxID=690850 RepID=F3YXI8_DESAF|nr:ABC transporter substrate-binding protein [Desulfocurvibacter africanus]EGJ51765.1 ABC-type transporter, periplasmic subunit family 3 [Desulfocurvibacter africanus subsp. africanus str. Walvis Bay]